MKRQVVAIEQSAAKKRKKKKRVRVQHLIRCLIVGTNNADNYCASKLALKFQDFSADIHTKLKLISSCRAVEYTDYISAEG